MKGTDRSTVRGMTLFEMMFTVMLIAIIYSIGSLSIRHYRTEIRIDIAASRLYNTMREARSKAVKDYVNTMIIFDRNAGSYTLCLDTNLSETCDETESVIEYPLEPGIVFAVSSSSEFTGLPFHNSNPAQPVLEGNDTLIFRRTGTTNLDYFSSVVYLVPAEELNPSRERFDRFRAIDVVSTTGVATLWSFQNGAWVTR
ncbi:MAG: prepilin-type N-terminal cleavage/methylation domain-containing protein [Deltaproteobacteria bacterium]|nr:MAG: prepilin-type N-terminal cleavage/methylation domain-containing protein [Deltaproteobacteria bacterium]